MRRNCHKCKHYLIRDIYDNVISDGCVETHNYVGFEMYCDIFSGHYDDWYENYSWKLEKDQIDLDCFEA